MTQMRIGFDKLRGTTLFELMIVLAVAATLLGLGVPAFQRLALDSTRDARVRQFVASVQRARSEAIARNSVVVLCPSADRVGCAQNSGGTFESGWIVHANAAGERPPQRPADEPPLLVVGPWASNGTGEPAGTIRSNREALEFRPPGTRSTNATVTFCDRRGAAEARAVIVSYTGRPRVARTGPGDRALQCPSRP